MTIVPTREALPTDEIRVHTGEEFCYVLQGVLRLWHGEMFFDLYPGDSVYFQSMVRHRLENLGDQPVVLLSLITPTIF